MASRKASVFGVGATGLGVLGNGRDAARYRGAPRAVPLLDGPPTAPPLEDARAGAGTAPLPRLETGLVFRASVVLCPALGLLAAKVLEGWVERVPLDARGPGGADIAPAVLTVASSPLKR